MSLLLPTRETAEPMGSAKRAAIHASVARNGYLQGSDKAEAAPPGPSRPPHPQGTKTTGSHQSSLTSLEGSGISEHLPQKSLRQAGGLPPEVSMSMGRGSPRDFCPRAFADTLPAYLLFPSLPVTVLPNVQGLHPVTSRTPARNSCLSSESLEPIVCVSLSLLSTDQGESLTPWPLGDIRPEILKLSQEPQIPMEISLRLWFLP